MPDVKKKVPSLDEKDEIFQAPVFVREPTAKQVSLGGKLTLRVVAEGKPRPSYQWYLNGKKISGATSDRYMVNKTRREHAGSYTCEAKNFVGKTSTRGAMVAFLMERIPDLVVAPASATVPMGQPFCFKITSIEPAKLRKYSFQWTFNGKRITGARSPELEFGEVKKKYEGEYRVLLFVGGDLRSSNKVMLSVAESTAQAAIIEEAAEPAFLMPMPSAANDDFFFNPEDDDEISTPPVEEPSAVISHASPNLENETPIEAFAGLGALMEEHEAAPSNADLSDFLNMAGSDFDPSSILEIGQLTEGAAEVFSLDNQRATHALRAKQAILEKMLARVQAFRADRKAA